MLGQKLGLNDITYLQADAVASYGAIGEFQHSLSEEEFIDLLKNTFGLPYVRCSEPLNKPIKKVAFQNQSQLNGSGQVLIVGRKPMLDADYRDIEKAFLSVCRKIKREQERG